VLRVKTGKGEWYFVPGPRPAGDDRDAA